MFRARSSNSVLFLITQELEDLGRELCSQGPMKNIRRNSVMSARGIWSGQLSRNGVEAPSELPCVHIIRSRQEPAKG